MGRDPRPTPQSREAARREAQSDPSDGLLREGGNTRDQASLADRAVVQAMSPFLTRDDGWLRVVPQDDGLTCYFKWKFTGGPHVNHYVMCRYPYTESAEALARLARKVDAVDRGVERPVKDHYFKG